MNYHEEMARMLRHLGHNWTNDAMSEMVEALGKSIAIVMSAVETEERMNQGLELVFELVRVQAKGCFQAREAIEQVLGADEFLRTHFNPEKLDG